MTKISPLQIAPTIVGLGLLAFTFGFGFSGCSGESHISGLADRNSPEILYETEAQQMEVFYSGELFPPDTLTRKFIRELHLLRSQWGDSIPEVKAKFVTPWAVGSLGMEFDNESFESIMAGSNENWERLMRKYQLEDKRTFSEISGFISVKSSWQLHPYRLAEFFVDFPGLMWLGTRERPHPYPDFFVRMQDGLQVKYFFSLSRCGDVLQDYMYFSLEDSISHFLGIHIGCPQTLDSSIWQLPFDSAYARFMFLSESLETYRAPWVDTARQEMGRLEFAPQFRWTRQTD